MKFLINEHLVRGIQLDSQNSLNFSEALSTNSTDSQSSTVMEESVGSDASLVDDEDEGKPIEDELEDYVKPSFWLFIERNKKPHHNWIYLK